jgi:uncharacterized membrane protein
MRRYFRSPKDFATLFRRHFLTGVFVLIPLLVVAWMLGKVFEGMSAFLLLIPEEWKPINHFDPFVAEMVNFGITIGCTIVFAILVSALGWFSKNFIGAKILSWLSELIQRIPVVRAIYSSLNQLLTTMAAGDKQRFSRVVYVEYPRKGSWALAFVTGPARVPPEMTGGPFLNLYVPTTPNPTSGFHLIVPESDVRDSHLNVEDAFKTILSLGIAQGEAKIEV